MPSADEFLDATETLSADEFLGEGRAARPVRKETPAQLHARTSPENIDQFQKLASKAVRAEDPEAANLLLAKFGPRFQPELTQQLMAVPKEGAVEALSGLLGQVMRHKTLTQEAEQDRQREMTWKAMQGDTIPMTPEDQGTLPLQMPESMSEAQRRAVETMMGAMASPVTFPYHLLTSPVQTTKEVLGSPILPEVAQIVGYPVLRPFFTGEEYERGLRTSAESVRKGLREDPLGTVLNPILAAQGVRFVAGKAGGVRAAIKGPEVVMASPELAALQEFAGRKPLPQPRELGPVRPPSPLSREQRRAAPAFQAEKARVRGQKEQMFSDEELRRRLLEQEVGPVTPEGLTAAEQQAEATRVEAARKQTAAGQKASQTRTRAFEEEEFRRSFRQAAEAGPSPIKPSREILPALTRLDEAVVAAARGFAEEMPILERQAGMVMVPGGEGVSPFRAAADLAKRIEKARVPAEEVGRAAQTPEGRRLLRMIGIEPEGFQVAASKMGMKPPPLPPKEAVTPSGKEPTRPAAGMPPGAPPPGATRPERPFAAPPEVLEELGLPPTATPQDVRGKMTAIPDEGTRLATEIRMAEASFRRANNLNLDQYATDAVKDVIRNTAKQINIPAAAAAGGKISDMILTGLGRGLGWTPDTVARMKMGPKTAAIAKKHMAMKMALADSASEVASATSLLKSATDAGVQARAYDTLQYKLNRHREIQVRATGMAADIARAQRVGRIQIAEDRARVRLLEEIGNEPLSMAKSVELATRLEKLSDPMEISRILSDYNPNWWDKFQEWAAAIKLTSPPTYERNFIGNTLALMADPPLRSLEVLASRGKVRPEEISASFGALMALPRAAGRLVGRLATEPIQTAKAAGRFLVTEDQALLRQSQFADPGFRPGAIPGKFGTVTRSVFRALSEADLFFKELIYEREVHQLAYRQAAAEGLRGTAMAERVKILRDAPTPEMNATAVLKAREGTFQEALDPMSAAGLRFLNSEIAGTGVKPLRLVVPFYRTAVNLYKYGFRHGPVTGLISPRNITDLMKGGIPRAEAVARLTLGHVVGAAAATLAYHGYIAGRGPSDRGERDLLMATGWRPYSVKIGGSYYSYKQLQPLSSFLALSANLAERYRQSGEESAPEAVGAVALELARNMGDQNFLMGLNELVEALQDPERSWKKAMNGIVTGATVPSGVGWLARILDPTMRKPVTLTDAFKARIPGLSESAPPALDVFGMPVKYEGGSFVRAITPVSLGGAVDEESRKVATALLGESLDIPRQGAKIKGFKITKGTISRIEQESGPVVRAYMSVLMDTGVWDAMDAEQKERKLREIITTARTQARAVGLVDEIFDTMMVEVDERLAGLDIPAPTNTQRLYMLSVMREPDRLRRWNALTDQARKDWMRTLAKNAPPVPE